MGGGGLRSCRAAILPRVHVRRRSRSTRQLSCTTPPSMRPKLLFGWPCSGEPPGLHLQVADVSGGRAVAPSACGFSRVRGTLNAIIKKQARHPAHGVWGPPLVPALDGHNLGGTRRGDCSATASAGGGQWRAELCLPALLLCCLILSHSFPPQGLASVLSYPVLQLTATRPCSMRRYVTFDGSSPMCYDLSVRNYTTVSSAYGKAGPPIACQ